jgi:hypothetical protein
MCDVRIAGPREEIEMAGTAVNVDNYARAEVASQIDRLVGLGATVNEWVHFRGPTPLDKQTVIRMNRDTLYSLAIADISGGASLTMPDGAGRYQTMMVINEDGYINRVFHEAGEHPLEVEEFDTPFVLLAARTLANPADADDIAAANRLQDSLVLAAASRGSWTLGEFDEESYQATKKPLLELGRGIHDTKRTFGRRDHVDPVRFLIGSAVGFGGLPEEEAYYAIRAEPIEVGRFRLTVANVPVDGFWSVSIYNKDGYFEENPYGSYSVNSVTAASDDDGSVTLHFGPEPDGSANYLHVMEGWNYVARMYRPHASILDGTWSFPEPQPVR